MNKKQFRLLIFLSVPLWLFAFTELKPADAQFVSYEVDLTKQDLKLYWKDDSNKVFKSIGNLKNWLAAKGERLVFAMNAGMYTTDNSPVGLFIENYRTLHPLNTKFGEGNFYLKPNGVLYTTGDNTAVICQTDLFPVHSKIRYATQSGPMLVINDEIHPSFKKGSTNLNIRNGVGVLPNNHLIFAMSKNEISLYDFADYFKKMGCKNALYLDGFVSRTYLPEANWIQTDGNFGVIIGVTKRGN